MFGDGKYIFWGGEGMEENIFVVDARKKYLDKGNIFFFVEEKKPEKGKGEKCLKKEIRFFVEEKSCWEGNGRHFLENEKKIV